MAADEPLPISIMVITAATPMMMPSAVRAARMGLRLSAFSAVRIVRRSLNSLMLPLAAPYWPSTITPSLI